MTNITRASLCNLIPDYKRNLVGVEYGGEIRAQLGLDTYDRMDGVIMVVFPEQIITVTPSFWRGFFNPSLVFLGKDIFQEKYKINTVDFQILVRFTEFLREQT